MPLSIPSLASEMKAEIEAVFGAPANSQRLLDFTTAVSTAIINHIKANADINLQAGDIVVPAAGILDGTSLPCTGSAQNQAGIISARIE